MQIKEFLKQITEASGVSGYEAPVRELVRAEFQSYADEVRSDAMGSLIALKKGDRPSGTPRRSIMLAGHMDEIGFMVTLITKEGYLKFQTLGGWWSFWPNSRSQLFWWSRQNWPLRARLPVKCLSSERWRRCAPWPAPG